MTMKRSTLAPALVIAAVIILLSAVLITIGITYATEQEPPLPDASSSVSAGSDASGMLSEPSQPSSDSSAPDDESSDAGEYEESADTSSVPELGQSIPAMSAGTFNSVDTQYCILYDVTHDAVLYSKNSTERAYPASVTKLLTAAVASDYCDLDTPFTVGDELDFVQPHSSLAYLEKGQTVELLKVCWTQCCCPPGMMPHM